MIRALVVDDSAFMRKAISMMLESDPEITVVDTARNGAEGVEKVQKLRPDVVTMDVEMPIMDGITAVRTIMKSTPTPILMISSLTQEGAQVTVEALQAGAVDFIPKQSSYISLEITKKQGELIEKIKSIARSRSRIFNRFSTSRPADPVRSKGTVPTCYDTQVLAVGISTGGPFALQRFIPSLSADFPVPVAIVQHMPPHFTRSLAERLDSMSPLHVVEAEPGMILSRGNVYIAAGGKHMVFQRAKQGVVITTPEQPADTLHRPSVDVMFDSINELFPGHVLGVVMTGMGKDGFVGAQHIKRSGGKVFAQDEASCVVYGMPRAIVDGNLADAIISLENMAGAVSASLGAGKPRLASSM